ncbi:hypothetical protein HPP92_016737 [Vanilla planifolia]|uniref:Uncharacterized protein n=1 Tax=Vanilla planifolia TaxID=51239 RepID=A0A835QFD1_VANPL|nr:hypothetical protein HPP92_016737 [Vanilla planifolia]
MGYSPLLLLLQRGRFSLKPRLGPRGTGQERLVARTNGTNRIWSSCPVLSLRFAMVISCNKIYAAFGQRIESYGQLFPTPDDGPGRMQRIRKTT